jgi:hypothetical protein
MLLTASYAGWIAHESWQDRIRQKRILEAAAQFAAPNEIESNDDVGVLILKGSKERVGEMKEAIKSAEKQ